MTVKARLRAAKRLERKALRETKAALLAKDLHAARESFQLAKKAHQRACELERALS